MYITFICQPCAYIHVNLGKKIYLVNISEFQFDGFSADTCRGLVAMMDVSLMNIAVWLSIT